MDVLTYPRYSMRLTDLVTPLKPLEAMAQGKLVIASDVGGHKELICDGKTGLLFTAGDPRAFAAVVVGAITSPDRCEAIRLAARQHVEAERNWKAIVDRYRGVYQSALNGAM